MGSVNDNRRVDSGMETAEKSTQISSARRRGVDLRRLVQGPGPEVGPLVEHGLVGQPDGRRPGFALGEIEQPAAEDVEYEGDKLGIGLPFGKRLFRKPSREGLQEVVVPTSAARSSLLG